MSLNKVFDLKVYDTSLDGGHRSLPDTVRVKASSPDFGNTLHLTWTEDMGLPPRIGDLVNINLTLRPIEEVIPGFGRPDVVLGGEGLPNGRPIRYTNALERLEGEFELPTAMVMFRVARALDDMGQADLADRVRDLGVNYERKEATIMEAASTGLEPEPADPDAVRPVEVLGGDAIGHPDIATHIRQGIHDSVTDEGC